MRLLRHAHADDASRASVCACGPPSCAHANENANQLGFLLEVCDHGADHRADASVHVQSGHVGVCAHAAPDPRRIAIQQ